MSFADQKMAFLAALDDHEAVVSGIMDTWRDDEFSSVEDPDHPEFKPGSGMRDEYRARFTGWLRRLDLDIVPRAEVLFGNGLVHSALGAAKPAQAKHSTNDKKVNEALNEWAGRCAALRRLVSALPF